MRSPPQNPKTRPTSSPTVPSSLAANFHPDKTHPKSDRFGVDLGEYDFSPQNP
ncbi:hypothetical protein NIES39_O00810 [Arthrospira platensis NIES-39]|nr:hypothetical protein NIES39_O00810 [Arthrospira platensis NIES-39]